jgi:rare lipoprotein A
MEESLLPALHAATQMKQRRSFTLLMGILLIFASCAGPRLPVERRVPTAGKQAPASAGIPATQRPYQIFGKTYHPLPSHEGFAETGIASWYGKDFHGRKTSNGETYDMHAQTAAHKLLPMNTYVLVKNLENGRETMVRINDRGPFVKGRIIDLSYSVAQELDIISKGTARVKITALGETAAFGKGRQRIERFLPHANLGRGEFFVQIGSFLDRGNAEKLQGQMVTWSRKAVIQPHEQEGRRYYRVQVSAGNDLTQARRLERVLSEAGFPEAFVVAR